MLHASVLLGCPQLSINDQCFYVLLELFLDVWYSLTLAAVLRPQAGQVQGRVPSFFTP